MDTTNYEEDENIDKLEEIKDLMFTRDSNSKVIEQIEVVDEDDMDFLDLEDTQPVRLDVQNHRSGKIRISNRQAQADYSVVKTEKRSKNGNTTYYKKSTTVNDEKIADTCIEIFQNSNVDKMLGLDEMKEETVNQVLALFEKKGIVITDNTTNKEELLIKRKREVAYEQLLKRKIEKVASCEYQVDFDQFIEMTGIKTAQQRIGEALKVLDGVQSKNFFEWSEERLDKDFNIVRDIVKIGLMGKNGV